MSETPFLQFIVLVEMDQAINLLQNSTKKIEQDTKQYLLTEKSLSEQIEHAKSKLHDVRKHVDMQELEMKRLDQQESEKKKRLELVANNKEYQSLKAEIDQIRKTQHGLEDELIQSWQQFENTKKEYDVLKQTSEQKIAEVQQQITSAQEKLAAIKADIAHKEQERNEKEKGIPQEWLEKYRIMRTRVTDPVVPVFQDSCSACFYKISPSDLQALQRNKLVQCKDCFRLLYLEQIARPASE